MNIKMADFLFEDEDKDTSNQDDTAQDKTGQESSEQKKRLKFREPIDNDFMFDKNNPEVTYSDVNNILAPNLAKTFKELSKNLSGNDEFQKNIENFSEKEKEKFKKIRKYADSQPLGLLDNTLLLQIFKRNLAIGLTSKVGRIHLNPFQMTTGAGQVEGATTADLKKYEKLKTFFAILVDELSRPVLCLGKVILFMMPAIEKDCSDAIDFINLTYPGIITKDDPFISSVDKVAFTLLTKEDFKKLQTNPLAAVKSAMSREKKKETNENFIYQKGLKSLLFEGAGIANKSTTIGLGLDSTDMVKKSQGASSTISDAGKSTEDTGEEKATRLEYDTIDSVYNNFKSMPDGPEKKKEAARTYTIYALTGLACAEHEGAYNKEEVDKIIDGLTTFKVFYRTIAMKFHPDRSEKYFAEPIFKIFANTRKDQYKDYDINIDTSLFEAFYGVINPDEGQLFIKKEEFKAAMDKVRSSYDSHRRASDVLRSAEQAVPVELDAEDINDLESEIFDLVNQEINTIKTLIKENRIKKGKISKSDVINSIDYLLFLLELAKTARMKTNGDDESVVYSDIEDLRNELNDLRAQVEDIDVDGKTPQEAAAEEQNVKEEKAKAKEKAKEIKALPLEKQPEAILQLIKGFKSRFSFLALGLTKDKLQSGDSKVDTVDSDESTEAAEEEEKDTDAIDPLEENWDKYRNDFVNTDIDTLSSDSAESLVQFFFKNEDHHMIFGTDEKIKYNKGCFFGVYQSFINYSIDNFGIGPESKEEDVDIWLEKIKNNTAILLKCIQNYIKAFLNNPGLSREAVANDSFKPFKKLFEEEAREDTADIKEDYNPAKELEEGISEKDIKKCKKALEYKVDGERVVTKDNVTDIIGNDYSFLNYLDDESIKAVVKHRHKTERGQLDTSHFGMFLGGYYKEEPKIAESIYKRIQIAYIDNNLDAKVSQFKKEYETAKEKDMRWSGAWGKITESIVDVLYSNKFSFKEGAQDEFAKRKEDRRKALDPRVKDLRSAFKEGDINKLNNVLNGLDDDDKKLDYLNYSINEFNKDIFSFLNDRTVQKALKETDKEDLVNYLIDCNESSTQKVFSNLSQRAQERLREDIEIKQGDNRPEESVIKDSTEKVINAISNLINSGNFAFDKNYIKSISSEEKDSSFKRYSDEDFRSELESSEASQEYIDLSTAVTTSIFKNIDSDLKDEKINSVIKKYIIKDILNNKKESSASVGFSANYDSINRSFKDYLKKSGIENESIEKDSLESIMLWLNLNNVTEDYVVPLAVDNKYFKPSDKNKFISEIFKKFNIEDLVKDVKVVIDEEDFLTVDKDSEELAEKYQKKFGPTNWEKFKIYAYFNSKKRLARLISENNNLYSKNLLTKAIFDFNNESVTKLFEKNLLDTVTSIDPRLDRAVKKLKNFRQNPQEDTSRQTKEYRHKPLDEKEVEKYLKLSIMSYLGIGSKEVEKPLCWMSSIEETDPQGELTKEEANNLNQKKIKALCRLTVESTYKSLIKDEWQSYLDKKENIRKDKKSRRQEFYRGTGSLGKSFVGAGILASVAVAPFAALPYAAGAMIFQNELGAASGFGFNAIANLFDGVKDGQDYHDQMNQISLQQKLKDLDYDVDLDKETDRLYEAYKDIVSEMTPAESKKEVPADGGDSDESVLNAGYYFHTSTLKSLLFEDTPNESKPKKAKKEFIEIDEQDVMQIIRGTGLKIFSADFNNKKIYNNFMEELNGILRKNAGIVIKNIKNISLTKTLAVEHASNLVDPNAQRGQAASPLIDMIMRDIGKSDDETSVALAKVINGLNHSGSDAGRLLILMMLLNPEGFAQMASKAQSTGNRDNMISNLLNSMAETPVPNAQETVQELKSQGVEEVPEKLQVSAKQMRGIKGIVSHIVNNIDKKYLSSKMVTDQGTEKTISDLIEISENTQTNIEHLSKVIIDNLFKKSSIEDEDYVGLKEIIAANISIKSTLDYANKYDDDFNVSKFISNAMANNKMLLTKERLNDLSDIAANFDNLIENTFKKFGGDKNVKFSKLFISTAGCSFINATLNLNKTIKLTESFRRRDVLRNNSYITGSLSSLLFEDFRDKKDRNINKKDDKIDLRKEWLKLWDI